MDAGKERASLIDYSSLAIEIRDQVVYGSSVPQKRILSRLDAFIENSKSETLRGDATLSRLYEALDSCGLQRTSTQRFFHKCFVRSILPWVFGKAEFAKYKDRILQEEGIHPDKYNQYTLISTVSDAFVPPSLAEEYYFDPLLFAAEKMGQNDVGGDIRRLCSFHRSRDLDFRVQYRPPRVESLVGSRT